MKQTHYYLSICFMLLFIQKIDGQSGGNDQLQIYSPQVYALAKYGDIPVDISTGVPEISIPLMSISDRDISLDVSLSYHATGIKVDQEATWVGLGWVLNAGGVITRQVRGIKDGYGKISGNFNIRPVIPDYDYTKTISQYISEVSSSLDEIAYQNNNNDTFDGEPDIFYYNFCGKVGKFYLDNNAKGCFFKYEDFKVEFIRDNNKCEKFIITDDKGIKYEFSQLNILMNEYTDEWYLMKMTSPSGGEINFEYNNKYEEDVNYRTYSACFIEVMPMATIHQIDNFNYHGSWLSYAYGITNLLSKITTKSGNYIAFKLSATEREDGANTTQKALEEIHLYNNKNEIQKKIRLGYGYFAASNNRRYKTYNNQTPANLNYLNYRLRLDSVKEISTNGVTGATYQFEYYGNNNPNTDDIYTLPYRLSTCQDHWGYYNYSYNTNIFPNNPANRVIAPDQCLSWYTLMLTSYFTSPPNGSNLASLLGYQVTGGANREPNIEAVKAGTLKKIIYPTGGYTQFEFEPNMADNIQIGGIRIKHIESDDGNGEKVIKKYTYVPFWGTTNEYYLYNSGSTPYYTIYYNPCTEYPNPAAPVAELLMSMGIPPSMAMKPLVQVIKIDGSSQIKLGTGLEATYSKVTETITGGGRTEYQYSCKDNFLDNSNGYFTVNEKYIDDAFTLAWVRTILFHSSPQQYAKTPTNYLAFPFPEPISNDWQNRLLTNKKVYREDGTLISEDSIFYRVEISNVIPGYKVDKFADYDYLYTRYYTIGGLVKVSKEVNWQNTPGQTVRTEKQYDYTSPLHKQVTESRTWNSSGNLISVTKKTSPFLIFDSYRRPCPYNNLKRFSFF